MTAKKRAREKHTYTFEAYRTQQQKAGFEATRSMKKEEEEGGEEEEGLTKAGHTTEKKNNNTEHRIHIGKRREELGT